MKTALLGESAAFGTRVLLRRLGHANQEYRNAQK